MEWGCYAWAEGVEVSEFCLFLVVFPERCISSISPRFYFRKHTFCFLPLVAILESPVQYILTVLVILCQNHFPILTCPGDSLWSCSQKILHSCLSCIAWAHKILYTHDRGVMFSLASQYGSDRQEGGSKDWIRWENTAVGSHESLWSSSHHEYCELSLATCQGERYGKTLLCSPVKTEWNDYQC
jgi:hypothetical protein